MELDSIKLQTTWNDAAGSINSNFQKIKQALATNGGGGGTADIVVDTAMSDTSDNAVANKVIKAYVDNAINDIDLPQGSEYITVKEGVISLDVDSQGGLGNTGQGLGIVAIPTSIMTGIEQYVEEEIEGLADDIKANPNTYIQLKTINGMEIYGEGNIAIEGGSSEGASGLTAINVNSQSFQPDLDGIVTLPDYRPLDKYNQDLAKKVDKVDGKGLSTNDYTTAEKNKLAGIAAGAEVNVQSDWNATSGDAFIKNKPTLSVVAISGSYNDLSDKPTIPVEVTERTVAEWGFTKNTGTYIKPTTGIPKSHLASDVQTSLGLADTALQPSDLEDYPTTTQVSNALTNALKNYALAQDLTAVDERLADVEAFFDSKEDADSLVNKWHEIVDFLDATEGDTLDSILSTYAKGTDLASAIERIAANEVAIETHTSQISSHAARLNLVEEKATNNATAITNIQKLFTDGKANKAIADGNGNNIVNTYATKTALAATDTNVTANANAISTLKGYFTGGKANNADKLDGYDSSYFATAANLNNLTSRVSTVEGEIDGLQEDNETFMAWYNAVGKYFKYDSVNDAWYLDGDFYTTGQNAAGGVGEEEGSTGGGLDEDQLEEYLTTNKYVTQTWVSNQGFAKTANLGALASKDSLAFSELTSKPTTLSGYGITDGMHWIANMDKADTTYFRHAGYGYPAGGWNDVGPAIAFGISTYYAQIQAGNDTNTPYMFFRPTSNGVTGETWFRFLFDVGNSNIDSERFSCRGDLVLHRNTADGSTFVNYGPYTNDSAALNLYGRVRELYTTDGVLIGGSKVLTESSGDGRYFPLTGNRAITGSVTIESGLTVTGSASITGGLSKIPQIYGPPVTSTEGNYFKWTLFYQTGNDTMYIQAGKNSGTSTDPYKGNIAFSGYGGKNATRVDFSADATYFNGDTLSVSGATTLNSFLTVFGLASFNKGIEIASGQSIAFVDSNGVKQYITLDEENGAIKVIGNFFATGQNAAGGAGGEELGMLTSWENVPTNLEGVTLSASLGIDLYNNSKKVLTSWDDIPEEGDEGYEDFVLSEYTVSADLVQTMNDKITELSGRTIPESVAIKLTNMCAAFATESTLTYSNVSSYGLALTQIYGLRDGIYTKVIDDTSSIYNKVWEYGAEYSSSGYTFYFRMGDKTITLKSTGTLASSSYTITHNL